MIASSQGLSRPLPQVGLVTVVFGSLLVALLHVIPADEDIDPIRRTISEYQLGPNRWIFDLGVLLVAAGSAAVFAALVRRGAVRPFSATTVFGAAWTLGLVAIVAFQKTDWSVGPSTAGTIHRYASIVAFVSLPLAVLAASRAAFPPRSRWRFTLAALAVISLAWFAVILGAVTMMMFGGEPWWQAIPLGLVERGLAFSEALAIGALGVAVRSVNRHDGGHSAADETLRVPC